MKWVKEITGGNACGMQFVFKLHIDSLKLTLFAMAVFLPMLQIVLNDCDCTL